MLARLVSALITILSILFGGLMGFALLRTPVGVLAGTVLGLLWAAVSVKLLSVFLRVGLHTVVGGALGLFFGGIVGFIVCSGLLATIESPDAVAAAQGLIMMTFSLGGLQLGAARFGEFRSAPDEHSSPERIPGCILDTSVIVDGRISDVCETGFIAWELVIPEFVLKELQLIADSSDPTKRTRGRRGLDILNKIQKQSFVRIRIDNTDYPDVKEVDQKLIAMAKATNFPIVTNDFNLNKVAEVHSIQVLNMNQLANSLKPIVLPGEIMRVQVLKEGKEPAQGVAYLDDGTMVVIDQGRKFIGKNVEATVTSVLQTPAGRMIFASIKTKDP